MKKETLIQSLLFFLKLNLLSIPLYLVIYFNLNFQPMQELIAKIVSNAFSITGIQSKNVENVILIAHQNKVFEATVSWDSTGWKFLYALVALAIATPIEIRKKLFFLSITLPLAFILNIIRIFSTIFLALSLGFQNFEFFHLFLWRFLLVGFVLGSWIIWIGKEKYNTKKVKLKVYGRYKGKPPSTRRKIIRSRKKV